MDFIEFKKEFQAPGDEALFKLYQEKTKQAAEIKRLGVEERSKTKQVVYDFLKFFLGTFVLGVAAAATTYIFKNFELKIKQRQAEMTSLGPHIQNYMNLLSTDSNKFDRAFYMTEFLSYTITEDQLKQGFGILRDSCYQRMKNKTKVYTDSLRSLNNYAAVIQNNLFALKLSDSAKIAGLQWQLATINVKKNAIVQDAIKTFDAPPVQIAAASEPQYRVISDEDRFTAVGYSSPILNDLAISVDKLAGEEVILRVKYTGAADIVTAIKIGQTGAVRLNNGYRMLVYLKDIKTHLLKKAAFYHIKVEAPVDAGER